MKNISTSHATAQANVMEPGIRNPCLPVFGISGSDFWNIMFIQKFAKWVVRASGHIGGETERRGLLAGWPGRSSVLSLFFIFLLANHMFVKQFIKLAGADSGFFS